MKHKMMMLALVAVSAAMFALPAVASAGSPKIDAAKYPLSFTSAGGTSELRSATGDVVHCTSNHGKGSYATSTTGTIELTFTGCQAFGGECHSAGQPSGTITTGTSEFHNVYLTSGITTPGVLVTPPTGGVFTTFECFFGFAHIVVTGNGIIGHLEAPKCGAKSKTGTLKFGATGSSQTYKQSTATGTIYNLKSSKNGASPPAEAAEVAEGTVTFAEEVTLTCI